MKINYPVLVRNQMKAPDGTILTSSYKNKRKTHRDEITGKFYYVDGGIEFMRRGIDLTDCEDLNVVIWSDEEYATIGRYAMIWERNRKIYTLAELEESVLKDILKLEDISPKLRYFVNLEVHLRNKEEVEKA
jgi:hypothetical protein